MLSLASWNQSIAAKIAGGDASFEDDSIVIRNAVWASNDACTITLSSVEGDNGEELVNLFVNDNDGLTSAEAEFETQEEAATYLEHLLDTSTFIEKLYVEAGFDELFGGTMSQHGGVFIVNNAIVYIENIVDMSVRAQLRISHVGGKVFSVKGAYCNVHSDYNDPNAECSSFAYSGHLNTWVPYLRTLTPPPSFLDQWNASPLAGKLGDIRESGSVLYLDFTKFFEPSTQQILEGDIYIITRSFYKGSTNEFELSFEVAYRSLRGVNGEPEIRIIGEDVPDFDTVIELLSSWVPQDYK